MKLKQTFIGIVSILLLVITLSYQQSTAAPQGGNSVYLPTILTPSFDLSISNIIVTQASQTSDNAVPLVQDRPTLVRIFAESNETSAINGVTVRLAGLRNGTQFDSLTIGPQQVPGSTSRAEIESSFNAVLPASWLTGDVTFRATVDPANAVGESNEGNNSMETTLTFIDVPPLSVTVVPIDYTHQGSVNPGFYPGQRQDKISKWLMDTYPVGDVNIIFRTPHHSYSADLGQGSAWSNLLDEITTLKQFDLGSAFLPEVYYGLIPINDGSRQWFSSGIAGIGWVGLRASVGLNGNSIEGTGSLAAHEIGHNFGRDHAPCQVSGDPNYPYSGASIGQFGMVEIGSGSPEVLHPDEYVDVMSYCEPSWVSDYTYVALLEDQLVNGRTAQRPDLMQNSLLVRGQILADGSISLKPTYILPQYPTAVPSASPYAIELVDEQGIVVQRTPVQVIKAEEPGISVQAILAAIPLPEASFASVRLMQQDTAVASRVLDSQANTFSINATTTQAADAAIIRWGIADVPAVVRYTADDGATWHTVGLDVMGGELRVDTSSLPGGASGRFEVLLADSGETAVFTTHLPAALPNQLPQAWISGHQNVTQGSFSVLQGFASDAEDGSEVQMTWLIDGEVVGEQSGFSLHELSIGSYIVELRVTDSDGASASSEIVVTIRP